VFVGIDILLRIIALDILHVNDRNKKLPDGLTSHPPTFFSTAAARLCVLLAVVNKIAFQIGYPSTSMLQT
jgi:hypothetical protein